MNHEHDLDLIAALVEGRSDDPAWAEGLIASCPICAEAFAAHRTVLAAIAAEPDAALDDLERRRLRTSIWEDMASATRSSGPIRPTPWWYRVAPVAAALVVVVGVGVGLSNGLIGGDEASDASLREDLRVLSEADAPTDGEDDAGQTAATSALEMPTDVTAAAEETTQDTIAAMSDEADTTAAGQEGAPRAFLSSDDLGAGIDRFVIRAEMVDFAHAPADGTTAGECVASDSATEAADRVLYVEAASFDGIEVWMIAFGEDGIVDMVVIYRVGDCEALFREDR